MNQNLPKISVITPSFNQGQYIRETIESVLSQDYPNVEYIIIDGGSTDTTLDVISEYQDKLDYFISEPDNGQSHALNKGFSKATGDIFCWLNSDDQFTPNALWAVAMGFHTSKVDIIAGICEVYEDGNLMHRHMSSCSDGRLPLEELLDLDNGWNAGQFFYQPEVFFTRLLWEKAGSYVREDCFYSMDYELWCRFAYFKANIHVVGTPLVHFRTHSEQKTADPKKFKAELVNVRDEFCKEHGLNWLGTKRPKVSWSKILKVAMVNDLGYQYGAGIAHMRIAGAFEFAGHEVAVFDLSSEKNIVKSVIDFSPHIVIFGNIHAVEPASVSILKELEQRFYCFWLTHDFWLLTGRCAYTANCNQYLSGCDDSCQTLNEYPVLAKNLIKPAWSNKRQFLSACTKFSFLANSNWSKSIINNALETFDNAVDVQNITLGVPTEIYSQQYEVLSGSKLARKKLSIAEDQFVIAFSVSSLSDKRKGGTLLVHALEKLKDKNITLIVIGRLDEQLDLPGIKLIKLGYVEEVQTMVMALNAADIYVGPSTEETFGQVFVEAALCGTPSIGFDITGIKDAIKEGVTGIKVKEMTPDGLASAIMIFYDNPTLLASISHQAPIYARNEFSLEASFGSFFNMLNKKGLIDKWGLPHKISFSKTSDIVTNSTQGWFDLSWYRKVNVITRKYMNHLIGVLPNKFTAKVAQLLPKRIEKWLIKWLVSRN